MEALIFFVAAVATLAGAIGVIVARTPLRSALSLVGALIGVAVLYFALAAPFLGAMQVLVYVGAVLVLFVFVIMTIDFTALPPAWKSRVGLIRLGGIAAVGYITYRLLGAFEPALAAPVDGSVRGAGLALLIDYAYLFEAVSLLLLVAIVAAVVVAQRRA